MIQHPQNPFSFIRLRTGLHFASHAQTRAFAGTRQRDIMIDMKTLNAPILDRLLDPVSRILTPEVAGDLVNLRFDREAQAHIDKLARKCNDGKLTDAERNEYETYVAAIDFISILQAKARAFLKRSPTA
jgi:hypothetical protein